MGKDTGILWCHHTFNSWWGCEKPLAEIGGKLVVSPECVGCYAETWDKVRGGPTRPHWGRTAPRRFFGDKHWREPLAWNRAAREAGERRRVFCLSMGDLLEDRRDLDEPRARLWEMIALTKHLDWLLLTKRHDMFWMVPWWVWELRNVWPGVTAGTQPMVDLRIPALLRLKAKYPHLITWVSGEPLLESVDYAQYLRCPGDTDGDGNCPRYGHRNGCPHLDWVIVGGESGPGARPMHPDWARSVRDQCIAANVPFFFKRWGEYGEAYYQSSYTLPGTQPDSAHCWGNREISERVGRARAGRLLDGRTWDEFPTSNVVKKQEVGVSK